MAWSLHRLLREVLPWVLLLLVLALLGGFTWLTHHPETQIVHQAKDWPVVGPLADAFLQRYAPTPPPGSVRDGSPDGGVVVERSRHLRDSWTLPPSGEPMWLLPGAVLRRQPSPDAPAIETLDAVSNVVRLDQQGDWYKVYHHGLEAWVYLENYAADGPPYGDEPEPPGPLPGRTPKAQELNAARQLLGQGAQERAFGDYTVFTDCQDAALLDYLDNLARHLEAVYIERYDRELHGDAKAVVVLYRREEDYRSLRDQLRELAGLPASGHHSRGLIALYVGQRSPEGVGATLVHELVHALNRRALGPALPPWLDEGLADDLATARVTSGGDFLVDELSGAVRPQDGQVVISGALGALLDLRRAQVAGRLPSVHHVMGLDWQGFVRSDDITLHYDVSAFWVRYLMQGQSGRHREGFRSFLDAVAEGEPVTSDALLRHVETDRPLLEAGFRGWLEFLAQDAYLPPVAPPVVEEGSEP